MNLIESRFGATRLAVLNVLDKAVYPRGFNDVQESGIYLDKFDVDLTVDRKGYRHVRTGGLHIPQGDTGYIADPRIKVSIELEMEEYAIPGLPELISSLDAQQKIDLRAKLQGEIEQAELAQEAAKERYRVARAQLNQLDGVEPK